MTLVSVVIPIYNVEAYIDKCIQSVLKQSYSNLEIILVDDGSPDRCGQICEEYKYKDERIKVIHKMNGGLGDARNAGVAIAAGEYLLFVDSDDYIAKDLVEKTVKVGIKASADIVIYDYVSVDEAGRQVDSYVANLPQNRKLSLKEMPTILNTAPSAVNKLFSTGFWKESNASFPVGKYYEDLGTIPKLFLLANSIYYIAEPLYYYFIRSNSIMHTKNFEKNFLDRTAVLDDVIEFYKDRHVFEQYTSELEFLTLDNGYFLPCKEIVLSDYKSEFLEKFRNYIDETFPEFYKNKYIATFTQKNKILFSLLRKKWYLQMLWLSYARRAKDRIIKGGHHE